jgi:hypothetical protein
LEKLVETGIFFKVAIHRVAVFIAAELFQDKGFSGLPGSLQKEGLPSG